MNARAAVLYAPRDLQVESFEVPDVGVDDAILRVEACGLCGTDHELYTGSMSAPYPIIPGHESVGIIEDIGPEAAERWGVSVGDRVALECWQSCRVCEACVAGKYRRCSEHGQTDIYGLKSSATRPALFGGYATHHYLSPDSLVLPVPDVLDPVEATLFNPLGAGIKWGVEVPGTGPGDIVAVLGPGIRGLCAVAAAKEAGADFVMVTGYGDRDHPRLELASAFGADLVVDVATNDLAKELRAATGGRLADVVVDVTANAPAAFGQAVRVAAVGARLVFAGVRGSRETPGLNPDAIMYKELTIMGTLGVDAPVYRQALELLATRKFPFDLLTRRVVGLEEAGDLLNSMAGNSSEPPPVHGVIVPA
ncbi:MAG: alcohol dehydrogenase [Candidatus Poriferisodalaceae bacterium]|jgi:alcohol dehydrogenase